MQPAKGSCALCIYETSCVNRFSNLASLAYKSVTAFSALGAASAPSFNFWHVRRTVLSLEDYLGRKWTLVYESFIWEEGSLVFMMSDWLFLVITFELFL